MHNTMDTRPLWRYMLEEHGISIVRGGDGTDPSGTNSDAFATGQHDAPPGSVVVQEPPAPQQQQQGNGAMPGGGDPFTDPRVQDAINRARTEERDKLYETIEDLRTNVTSLNEREAERLRIAEEERAAAESQQRTEAEADMDARALLEQRTSEWDSRFSQMQEQIATQNAVLEQERRLSALAEYRSNVLDQVRDTINPRLLDLVRGSSPEEIDASVAFAQQKSQEIVEDMREIMQQQRIATPLSSVTTTPGPEAAIGAQRTLTAQEIAALPMDQYEKFRPQLLAAASQQYRGR